MNKALCGLDIEDCRLPGKSDFELGILTTWQLGLHTLEIKSILWVGERIKVIFIDQNIELLQILPSLLPLPGTPRSLYFEAIISVRLVPHN